jgi:hypothetical protein
LKTRKGRLTPLPTGLQALPSEMPIQTPEQLLLTVNLTTAKTIGLDVPHSIVERAERLVE